MSKIRIALLLIGLALSINIYAKEYHVTKTGNNANSGTLESPLLTIQAAANPAQTGDVITVHAGIYREEAGDEVYLKFYIVKQHENVKSEMVTSDLLGRAEVPDQPFMDDDGSYLTIDIDYLGNKRKHVNPTAGPFENLKSGEQRIKVWPKN